MTEAEMNEESKDLLGWIRHFHLVLTKMTLWKYWAAAEAEVF